jgi:hypothetical protein
MPILDRSNREVAPQTTSFVEKPQAQLSFKENMARSPAGQAAFQHLTAAGGADKLGA